MVRRASTVILARKSFTTLRLIGVGCRRRAALTNTTSVNRFMVTAVLEDMRVPLAKEGPAMWRKVAEAIQLTREQRAKIVELWRAFR